MTVLGAENDNLKRLLATTNRLSEAGNQPLANLLTERAAQDQLTKCEDLLAVQDTKIKELEMDRDGRIEELERQIATQAEERTSNQFGLTPV
jgi:hypothetical protein